MVQKIVQDVGQLFGLKFLFGFIFDQVVVNFDQYIWMFWYKCVLVDCVVLQMVGIGFIVVGDLVYFVVFVDQCWVDLFVDM